MPKRREPETLPTSSTLVLRNDSPFWYVQYYDPGLGKMQRWSTGEKDKARAEAARARKLSTDSGAAYEAAEDVTICKVLDFYWTCHASRIRSAEQARIAVVHLKAFFGSRRVMALAPVPPTVDHPDGRPSTLIEGYLEHRFADADGSSVQGDGQIRNASAGPATIDRELSVLRAAIRFFKESHPNAPNPKIPSVELPAHFVRWLTLEEAERLIRASRTPHVALFIVLMLATAARPSALFDLTWGQVDLHSGIIHLIPDGGYQTAKHRPTVRIDPRFLPLLREAYAVRTCDYVIEYGGYPINSIKKAFRATVERAGLAGEDITPYTLRHTAATWMAQRGVSLWEIAGFLGHSDTRMVQKHYAHHHPDYMRAASSALGDSMAQARSAEAHAVGTFAKRDPEALRKRRQRVAKNKTGEPGGSPKSLENMVGAAGIEPATPTMST